MENIGYISLSNQIALQRQMEIVANNIANMNTVGYKSQHTIFNEFVTETENIEDKPISLVNDYGAYRNTAPGPIEQTGNPLDVALSGDGFIHVQDQDGNLRYTRNGSFQLNANNEIVNSSGNPILNQGNGSIAIPPGTTSLKIVSTGEILADGQVVGQIGMSEFDNVQKLKNIGNSMFDGDDATAQPAVNTQMFQGMLENSNVNPVLSMTEMIELSRRYQATANILTNDHERQRNAIQALSQV